ncbi:MAG TPA: MurT ligase domain-containing protein [Solirubrobacteraceae bacterium]|jgi:UDP-N-acetylmuramyl tripeptide synthase|nr:MurT ligase domain-containing protein [Solirubrobacteraceae bacterium]
MADPLAAKIALARAVGGLSRMRGGGATSAPGKALLQMEPRAIERLAGRLERGSVLVSATNGKTTSARMLAAILAEEGVRVVHNAAGANMAGGIASTLLEAARAHGEIAGELGLFEVDEFWLGSLVQEVRPRAILLGNLFRDQLDRYGELESIAERWGAALDRGPGAAARLVLNADDPLVADLGRERTGAGEVGAGRDGGVLYYGLEDEGVALSGMAHAADAKHCRNCGAPYEFERVHLGHLGHYRCPSCGQARPEPRVSARRVELEGVRTASFDLCTPEGQARVRLSVPGLYNVYNALGAAAAAHALEIPLASIVAGLERAEAAFGRAESVSVAGRELRIMLVKNPAGANEVLRTLALEPGEHDLLGVLNDGIADGRDVSWIWDADFEALVGHVRRARCSGTRAAELALRLRYAGVDPERIEVEEDLKRALDGALADAPEDARRGEGARAGGAGSPVYALPTYTAMLALRELLVARGEARSAWE